MNFLSNRVGRALFSVPFLALGAGHFTNAQQMAGVIPAYVPGGIAWVYVTGVGLVAAAISFNVQKLDRLAAYLTALLLLAIAFTVQLPGMTRTIDPADSLAAAYKMMAFAGFLKDLGLAGGALILASTVEKGR